MSARKVKQEIIDRFYIGIVEETIDPKRKGRIKVRIDRLHGKNGVGDFIPTESLPWAVPKIEPGGGSFGVPGKNKVVYITHIEGDLYSPEYFSGEHYNINLQEKLQDLDDTGYENFYAISYDDKHQYFHEKGEGIMFDYVKSNINLRENGDIRLNLRDNQSKLFLGTEDASQQAVLGNHWMDWMDELVQNLMGAKGGPYLGNMGAPVIPNPGMIEVLNKYLAIRETFLSDHVYIVDDSRVKKQGRKFDKEQHDDNHNDEKLEPTNNVPAEGYQPEERKPGAEVPQNTVEEAGEEDIPTTVSDNFTSSKPASNPTDDEKKKLIKPFEESTYDNGTIPIENLTVSKYLGETFPSDDDERKYLIEQPATSLDKMLDDYNEIKTTSMSNILAVKGYQNLERQQNIKDQYPTTAPVVGKDPYGFANQAELWFSVKRSDTELVDKIRKLINDGILGENPSKQENTMLWLLENSKTYKWFLSGKTSEDLLQWWHWIYDPTIVTEEEEEVVENTEFNYEFLTEGPKTWIIVYQFDDVIYTGEPTFSAEQEVLIQEAINALEDSFPDVDKMTLRNGATTPKPEPTDTKSLVYDFVDFGTNDTYKSNYAKSFTANLDEDDKLWEIIIVEYEYDTTDEKNNSGDSGQSTMDYVINSDKKGITVDIKELIEEEIGLIPSEDFKFFNAKITIIRNPIKESGELDDTREQNFESTNIAVVAIVGTIVEYHYSSEEVYNKKNKLIGYKTRVFNNFRRDDYFEEEYDLKIGTLEDAIKDITNTMDTTGKTVDGIEYPKTGTEYKP